MSLFKQVLADIEKGRLGLNEGLPLGLARTDSMLCGLQAGTYYLVGGDTGCLAKGTKVFMYDGTLKNAEDIKVDDLLMGPNSTPRKVLKLYAGEEQMYWIRQNKGIPYRVNENHILSLKASGSRATKKFGKVVNIKVKDYLKLNSYDRIHLKGYKTEGLDFSSQDITIDPYFLGLWLGDGSKDQPAITTIDSEIKTFITTFASMQRLRVSPRPKKSTEAVTYALVNFVKGVLNPLKEELRNYNLLFNKHIPKEYLQNSEEVRLQLLAGLLDADGHYSNNNGFEITQKSKVLAENIALLARSLGFYVHFKSKKAAIKAIAFECEVYRVTIYGDLNRIPTKIARKQAKISTRVTDPLVTGIVVEKDIVDNFYGFKLDQDNLFLLEDLTVTHNSGKSHFVNNLFLLNPLDHLRMNPGSNKKLKIIYFSFEMVAKVHLVRALPRYLWLNHGLVTSPNLILSRGQKNRLPDEIYNRITAAHEYFEWIEDHILFIDSTMGKTEIEKVLKKVACDNGTFVQDEFGSFKYTPNDPDLIILGILDHYGLSKKEDEAATKQIIDGISKVFVKYRNVCGFSFVALNQFNRDIQSSDRKKLGAIEPQLADFKDTAGSQEDADMVLALAYPWRYQYTTYKDFDISTLKDYFRCLHVLKNRNGEANKHIGLNFHGNLGMFLELPRVKDMTTHDYSRAIDLGLQAQDQIDKTEDTEN